MNAPAQIENRPAVGTPMAGGFFVGLLLVNGTRMAVIDAGKEGEMKGAWGKRGAKIDGARSFSDGLANTDAMAEAGSQLAKDARALRIGGFDDWHIPAKDAQELQYRHLKPTDDDTCCSYMDGYNANSVPAGDLYANDPVVKTEIEAYREGGEHALDDAWYWSSTQYSALYAFGQHFDDGLQGNNDEGNVARARAVRMIPW